MPSTIARVHASAERAVLVRGRPRVDVNAARLLAGASCTATRAARDKSGSGRGRSGAFPDGVISRANPL